MPLEVLVKYKDGSEEFYYIPISLMRGEKNSLHMQKIGHKLKTGHGHIKNIHLRLIVN